ncbi:glycosyltransferase family 4 protein [Oceaniglobus roseus]|uniref:glycosyltransferase family 4 protein n=1 Tax=Oceaniglobus roseus TaxID=1737570 RepID=UPI000C7F3706|nr:glycosyltransferase family 1 protein [Kandeliimicrobium roseum]
MTARCLDLTRLVSRAGLGPPTGVDRVELAYLDALLARPEPLFALCRLALGFALLDRAGAAALRARIAGQAPWGRGDIIGQLSRRLAPARRRAEADVRRLSRATCLRRGLGALAQRGLPPGTLYLNTGHSNLDAATFGALRSVPELRIAVLVHDTIPLDFPGYQRPGTPAAFEKRMRAVSAHADTVICNSRQTEADVQRHFTGFGRVPPCVTAHLGIDPPRPDASALPATLDPARPRFVAVGTIEPRKNHALLLDLWDRMAAEEGAGAIPDLWIVGRRGWNNEAVFARLDASPLRGLRIHETGTLDDGGMAALVQGAAALLFPSHAEGFGLPPVEAAALGTPVVCSPLPVLQEVLGDFPVYAEATDLYAWRNEVKRLAKAQRDGIRPQAEQPPTWEAHFNHVLNRLR